uniref:Uncharacterized protein n=1 Tax=Parascaris univalens TaxID=6257 RepID=A0A915BC01_PARUN
MGGHRRLQDCDIFHLSVERIYRLSFAIFFLGQHRHQDAPPHKSLASVNQALYGDEPSSNVSHRRTLQTC